MGNPLKELSDLLDRKDSRFTATVVSYSSGVAEVRGPRGVRTVQTSLALSSGDQVVVADGVVTGKVRTKGKPKIFYV